MNKDYEETQISDPTKEIKESLEQALVQLDRDPAPDTLILILGSSVKDEPEFRKAEGCMIGQNPKVVAALGEVFMKNPLILLQILEYVGSTPLEQKGGNNGLH